MNISEYLSSPEKREKVLLAAAGLLLVFVVGPLAYGYYWQDMKRLQADRTRLIDNLKKLENDTQNATEIKDRLEKLAAISLPPDPNVAQSAYQNWLLDLARTSGLREIKIDRGSAASVKDFYVRYTMTLNGRASLEQLATFLQRFQRVDHLQLIRTVSIRPLRESREMDVSIKVESLGLKQAKPSTTLVMSEKAEALSAEAERRMRRAITERAIFSAYVPPQPQQRAVPPPPPPSPPGFDHSPYCFVEAILEVDGQPQAWFNIRTEGKMYQLYEGQNFRLGGAVTCTVKKIEFDRVTIEAAGDLFTIRAGKSFAEYED